MRQRQSSLTIDIQYPVMSNGAAAFAVGGGPAAPPRPCAHTVAVVSETKTNLKTACFTISFQRRQHSVARNRKIRSEPDHDVGLQVRFFFEHRGRMTGAIEHAQVTVPVCRKTDQLLDGSCSTAVFFT